MDTWSNPSNPVPGRCEAENDSFWRMQPGEPSPPTKVFAQAPAGYLLSLSAGFLGPGTTWASEIWLHIYYIFYRNSTCFLSGFQNSLPLCGFKDLLPDRLCFQLHCLLLTRFSVCFHHDGFLFPDEMTWYDQQSNTIEPIPELAGTQRLSASASCHNASRRPEHATSRNFNKASFRSTAGWGFSSFFRLLPGKMLARWYATRLLDNAKFVLINHPGRR